MRGSSPASARSTVDGAIAAGDSSIARARGSIARGGYFLGAVTSVKARIASTAVGTPLYCER